jgi:hypothetical protein
MRGLRIVHTAAVILAGHAFMRNLRRGHFELATETLRRLHCVNAAFTWVYLTDNATGVPGWSKLDYLRDFDGEDIAC